MGLGGSEMLKQPVYMFRTGVLASFAARETFQCKDEFYCRNGVFHECNPITEILGTLDTSLINELINNHTIIDNSYF